MFDRMVENHGSENCNFEVKINAVPQVEHSRIDRIPKLCSTKSNETELLEPLNFHMQFEVVTRSPRRIISNSAEPASPSLVMNIHLQYRLWRTNGCVDDSQCRNECSIDSPCLSSEFNLAAEDDTRAPGRVLACIRVPQ